MKYSLGLDIGTSSIGWAVIDLDKKRIHDLGVRIFERPEDPQSGKSLAEPRRTARSTRRRLKRRRVRLNAVKAFFVKHNLLSYDDIDALLAPGSQYSPYEVRARAVREKVSNQELFLALYHIAKRRGYKSNRKLLEEKDAEGSRVLSALSENATLLAKYSSVGEALHADSKFTSHRRNKRDSYKNSFARDNFIDEVKAILKVQLSSGLDLPEEAIQDLLIADESKGHYSGIFSQRPFMTSDLIQKMRGTCELETSEPRAPRASYSFELFRLAQNLSHLRIVIGKEVRSLAADEIDQVVSRAKNIKTIKYVHIRDILGYKGNQDFKFAQGMIRGKVKADDNTNGEGNKFDELTFYHSVKSALKDSPDDWKSVESDVSLLDAIGEALTINKDDLNLRKSLESLHLSEHGIGKLLALNFSGFGHLSFTALRSITPHLLTGVSYDKAVTLAGYTFSKPHSGNKTKLPPLNDHESQQITNPVVKRAISQTIKVTNAIILKYGLPARIGIEAAGDLAKNFQERGKIKKLQDENADYNESIKQRLIDEFGVTTPTGLQITKFKLYNQQGGKCMYSGKPLDLVHLFSDERYGEIDHIIPFSRSGNDSLNNKVLVLTEENQNKGNLTPYEAWGSDEAKWTDYEARVKATLLPLGKQERLLAKNPPSEEWNARALNDTRYISKFLRSYIRENLKFADYDDLKGTQRVFTPSGQITSYLRRIWGVGSKSRQDNSLHHAVDACIVACIDQGVIQKVSSLNKYYELFYGSDKNEVTDKLTGEVIHRGDVEQHIVDVLPWEDFGKEVRIRTKPYSTPGDLLDNIRGLTNYDQEFLENIKPIFVSRMPKRSGKGATNKETIRSPKIVEGYKNTKGEPTVARKQRMPIASIKLKDLYDSPIRETDPKLYELLRKRLLDNNDDPKKAFTEPVYKPTKSGERGNIVRSIKVYDTANSKTGFYINDGKAFVNNGSMIRLDIYNKANKKGRVEHFFVPIYVHQLSIEKRGKKITKILPTPKGFTDVDDTFTKVASLYPNDYVRFTFGNKIEEGYYVKYGINNGAIQLIHHSSANKDKDSLIQVSGRSATEIQRFDISILGDNYKWI